MAHYIDGKDCMVSWFPANIGIQFIILTKRDVPDIRVDPFDRRLPFRCRTHLHASIPPPLKARLV
jgi:hypothetical protein